MLCLRTATYLCRQENNNKLCLLVFPGLHAHVRLTAGVEHPLFILLDRLLLAES